MRKTILFLFACWLSVMVKAQGQEVSFLSSAVEDGIRQHLHLSEEASINFLQLDTITSLDLSKRGITDIDDLVLMPNLRRLDLNNNMVDDLHPLTVLDSLEWVDLSFNKLKNINQMVYSNAKNMTVNVAFNYIGDFSLFGSITRCNFTLEGTGLQLYEAAPYFDVCRLVCDATVSPVMVHGLVRTNMTETPRLMCGDFGTNVLADGNHFKQALNGDYTETIPVFLNNGLLGDSTYLVPPITIEMEPGETVTLPTGLPESYSIKLSNAVQGTVVINGTELEYTAPDVEVSDTLSFSYNEFGVLKGFSQYCLGKPNCLLGDANNDKVVNVTDVMLIVNNILGRALPVFNRKNADVNKDNHISVADVMSVVKIVLSHPSHAPASARLDLENRMLIAANSSGCDIRLEGNAPFTACEMVLSLPEGCTLLDATLDNHQPVSHQIMVNSLSDGRHKVVIYAPANGQLVLNEGPMVNLKLSGKADGIKVSDIMCCNHRYETVELQDAVGMTTDLKDALSAGAENDTYSIQGIKTPKPKRGVFIKNRKKTVVK